MKGIVEQPNVPRVWEEEKFTCSRLCVSTVCLSVFDSSSHPQQAVCSRKFCNIINSTGHSIKQVARCQREQTYLEQHSLFPIKHKRLISECSIFQILLPRENSVKRKKISIYSKHCNDPKESQKDIPLGPMQVLQDLLPNDHKLRLI